MSQAGTSAGRSLPAAAPSPPSAPLIAPTGSAGLDCVADVVNAAAKPFQDAPPAEQGAAGWVAQGISGVVGVVGAPQMLLDVALVSNPIALALAAACPAMPAMTLGAMHLGVPHGHMHPPSLVPPNPVPIPLPSIGMVMGAGAVTVLINGMPAARAGDIGIAVTCCSLAPPFEIFTGSSNVFIGG
ncbi:MAG TPA: PAAR domain-containing protein, partial [Polyangiaceae bacterium]|nr:PAAR domain-containing protein [Polyangiaceae bacterium]